MCKRKGCTCVSEKTILTGEKNKWRLKGRGIEERVYELGAEKGRMESRGESLGEQLPSVRHQEVEKEEGL